MIINMGMVTIVMMMMMIVILLLGPRIKEKQAQSVVSAWLGFCRFRVQICLEGPSRRGLRAFGRRRKTQP